MNEIKERVDCKIVLFSFAKRNSELWFMCDRSAVQHYLLQLHGRSSTTIAPSGAPTQTVKESLYCRHFQNISNDGCVFHGLGSNGEELSKEVHYAVELQNHSEYWPPNHHQENPKKERNDPSDAVAP
jgi:hypothetical protein